MKKSEKEIIEDLVKKNVLTEDALVQELVKDINKCLKNSIEKSKKKIKRNKKFTSLEYTKEYLLIKLRFYSERDSVLKATIPL